MGEVQFLQEITQLNGKQDEFRIKGAITIEIDAIIDSNTLNQAIKNRNTRDFNVSILNIVTRHKIHSTDNSDLKGDVTIQYLNNDQPIINVIERKGGEVNVIAPTQLDTIIAAKELFIVEKEKFLFKALDLELEIN